MGCQKAWMLQASEWSLIVAVLSLLVTVLCARDESGDLMRIDGGDPKDVLKQIKLKGSGIYVLEINNFSLSSLPFNLGEIAPRIGRVSLSSLLAPSPITAETVAAIAACKRIKTLEVLDSSFRPVTNIRWVKLFFPTVTRMCMRPKALPIQSEADLEMWRKEKLFIESITDLTLESDPDGQTSPPLFKNLELFPKLKSIYLYYSNSAVLNNTEGSDVAYPRVEHIQFDKPPVGREFLRKLPAVFSRLKSMDVNAAVFEELTSKVSEDASILPFKNVGHLTVNCKTVSGGHAHLRIGEEIARVFPSLSSITICQSGTISLPHDPVAAKLVSVKSLEIYGGQERLELRVFEKIFPSLTAKRFVQI